MKALTTLIFIIFIGTSAMAQTPSKVSKVETAVKQVELNIKIEKTDVQENNVARLYRYKNSRVKKALSFRTKRNTSKIA